MAAHTGRCFRAGRRTKARKARQGRSWDRPIRWKVPFALRSFLTDAVGSIQKHAGMEAMKLAITRYSAHQTLIGKHAARGR